MDIYYNDNIVKGQTFNINETKKEPEIIINDTKSNNYSVIMIDIDAPVGKNDKNISFLHWWVANIELSKNYNQVWFDYFPPSPPRGSGKHHYLFYLLRQPGLIVKPTGMDNILSRAPFNIDYYISTLKMSIVDKQYFVIDS